MVPTLRVVRPTDDIERLKPFYRDGLGLELLYEFFDHEGFDGAMFGRAGAPYHFEFTRHRSHSAGRAPTMDHMLVFYLDDKSSWQRAVARMEAAGFQSVRSLNPYWDAQGRTFEDPDGYRLVLQNAAWTR